MTLADIIEAAKRLIDEHGNVPVTDVSGYSRLESMTFDAETIQVYLTFS